MRAFFSVLSISLCVVLLAGCQWRKSRQETPTAVTPAGTETVRPPETPIVTPGNSFAGRVQSVNPAGRFAVLSFPVGRMPAPGQVLHVYRGGSRQGEIRITGPTRDNLTVGDIIAGQIQPGDEVRED